MKRKAHTIELNVDPKWQDHIATPVEISIKRQGSGIYDCEGKLSILMGDFFISGSLVNPEVPTYEIRAEYQGMGFASNAFFLNGNLLHCLPDLDGNPISEVSVDEDGFKFLLEAFVAYLLKEANERGLITLERAVA